MAGQFKARQGFEFIEWFVSAGLCSAWLGWAGRGMAGQFKARQGILHGEKMHILTDDQRHHLSEAAIILQNLAGTQQDENERTHLENVCSLVFETRNKYQMPDPPTIHNSDGFAFKAGPHDDVPLLVRHLVTAKRYASDDPIDLEPQVFTIAVLNNKFDGETIYGKTCGVDWQCKTVATMQIGDWRFIDMELDFA